MSAKTLQEFQTLTDTEHASVSSGGLGYYKPVIELQKVQMVMPAVVVTDSGIIK